MATGVLDSRVPTTAFDAWIGGIDRYGVIAKMLEMV